MILVTGGLGYIGSHVVLSLLAQRQEVVIVDNLANASLDTLERLEYISRMYIPFTKIDIRNTPALNKVFEQYSIDTVVHTAGFKSLEESNLKPLEYYNDNVSCIMSLLRSMQRTGVRKLIHLSSLAVYGHSSLALHEQLNFNYAYPNPYIKSQQFIEEIIQDTFKTDNEWKIAILRLSNIAGAFEQGILGEVVTQLPKNIVPLAMQVAALQRDAIELQRYAKTKDGTVERSFVHVLDLCEVIQKVLLFLQKQVNVCEAFDIAGQVISIQQLLALVSEVTQVPIQTVEANFPTITLDCLGSSSQKAKNTLNWSVKRPIEKMIEDEWAFYRAVLQK
ncbi:NAD-dependent epimerase/dehydratase family protein [Acinetobacter larvae]|uniref:UDP-glucose 4-epimerase n=1 Tax=Acinetobacter larvae TaxID=1789224 RepID=A0A1B2M0I6_9GAMM|nr:NAD-dependent epimerase/dehydratase family protein [Acinetobacter larvae]AOA58671.1 UDP-glucose 4-epimerase [Acinetobacter larvae]